MAVDRDRVDLGDVPVEQMVTAAFLVRNQGNGQLRFTEAPFITVAEGC
jgi:hypothetical protein